MIEQVVSGGQNGADVAGLAAAHALGIATGGTAPKGFRVCNFDGTNCSNPELGSKYGLVESPYYDYKPRTIKNVEDSDGTVWFGYTESPGGKLTISTAKKLQKPLIVNPTVEQLVEWCLDNEIIVLNVAGNRASSFNPDIYDTTYYVVYSALKKLLELV